MGVMSADANKCVVTASAEYGEARAAAARQVSPGESRTLSCAKTVQQHPSPAFSNVQSGLVNAMQNKHSRQKAAISVVCQGL